MKKSILLAFVSVLCLMSNKSTAQVGTSLQFSQVLLLSSTVAGPVVLGTVPANKVWKVESFGGYDINVVYGRINGADAGALTGKGYNAGVQMEYQSWSLPVWLPTATTLGYTANTAGSLVWFSIIEFTVVP